MLAVMGKKNMATPMITVISHRSERVKTVYGFAGGVEGPSSKGREIFASWVSLWLHSSSKRVSRTPVFAMVSFDIRPGTFSTQRSQISATGKGGSN